MEQLNNITLLCVNSETGLGSDQAGKLINLSINLPAKCYATKTAGHTDVLPRAAWL